MDHDAPLTGGCLCGGVRFEADPPLGRSSYCHCTRCRRRSGAAASANVRVRGSAFRVIAGEEQVRCWTPPDGFAKCFCAVCGSALFSRDPSDPEVVGIRLGALDPGHGVRPSFRQWTGSAADWEPIPEDGLPRFEGRAPADVRGAR